jgi:hypothetical protein
VPLRERSAHVHGAWTTQRDLARLQHLDLGRPLHAHDLVGVALGVRHPSSLPPIGGTC